tara:strand:- start:2293 stop:3087 length:795 start_codon:yes stop_codon:yes gene_type:complete
MSDLDNSDNEDKLSVIDSDIDSDNDSILDDVTDAINVDSLSTTIPSVIKLKNTEMNMDMEDNINIELDADDENDDDDETDDVDDQSVNEYNETNILNASNIKQTTGFDMLNTSTNIIPSVFEKNDSDYESDDDEDEDDEYLQKFDSELKQNYLSQQHPESNIQNYDEIYNLSQVVRNKDNIIIDDLHKTVPILSKYEKTRILGIRAKQLNDGANPFIKITHEVTDGYIIALQELAEKKIPVIIRRPLPNGGSEYWPLKELEIIG